MDDLLSEFLTETAESLDVIDVELVRFESSPNDKNTLNNIFRLVHTIKGTCGFLGLPRLEAIAHAGETLLGKFRDGALDVTPDYVSLVLESIDQIKVLVAHLGEEGVEPDGDDRPIISRLEAAAEGRSEFSEAPAFKPAPVAVAAVAEPEPEPDDAGDPDLSGVPEGNGRWDADQGRYLRPGEVTLAELEAAFASVDGPPEVQNAQPTAPAGGSGGGAGVHDDDHEGRKGGPGPASIRVNVDVLESLMTMVSELVLTRNQLMQILRKAEDSEFKGPLQRLSSITAELQENVMKTRMQPIGSAWKKLPRIVRDASRDLGKKIELVMEGEQTELDRQVLELIKDPLTHMIRNSCDHGVEAPGDRLAAGKSEAGTIKLRAYHEGGHIIIEVGDDGAGLKTERIRQKAIEKGLVDPAEAHTMSDTQVHRMIFAPGFSTAAQVTNISGRGVGMDVVKTNVELIGGTIDLRAKQGEGTTFVIKIPLTLAIISALIVGAGEHRFAVPQLSVVELVRAGSRCEHKIEFIKNTRVLRLRDKLLPLVGLSDVLGLGDDGVDPGRADLNYIVVMQVGETRFGLIVDQVFDTEEIVVKPLSKRLGSMTQYSGATILGDGAVIMILDPNGVATSVASAAHAVRRVAKEERDAAHAGAGTQEQTSFLLFRAGGSEPRACPLSLITRLEDLDASTFEGTHRGPVVQYRGRLMPLVHPVGAHAMRSEGRQPVLVFSQGESVVGLAVEEILDIVEDRLDLQLSGQAPGVLGTAVLKNRSTEVIDLGYFLSQADPAWAEAAAGQRRKRQRVLLIDTHPFFRNMLAPLLKASSYDVEVASDLEEARARLAEGAFDAVLADTDALPDPEALQTELGAALQAPLIPMTSRQDAAYTALGPSVSKSDRHALLAALDQAIRVRGEAA
ncbi:MAG: hybrid sensor histidine kinase/response regulator [Hyphomonadaceae bacterium]